MPCSLNVHPQTRDPSLGPPPKSRPKCRGVGAPDRPGRTCPFPASTWPLPRSPAQGIPEPLRSDPATAPTRSSAGGTRADFQYRPGRSRGKSQAHPPPLGQSNPPPQVQLRPSEYPQPNLLSRVCWRPCSLDKGPPAKVQRLSPGYVLRSPAAGRNISTEVRVVSAAAQVAEEGTSDLRS